jgi:hypothetical protein
MFGAWWADSRAVAQECERVAREASLTRVTASRATTGFERYACPPGGRDFGELERSSMSELPVLSGFELRISRPTDFASRPKSSSDR